jgi:CubicO group peptidase (beta-lactamase class C family)
MTRPTTCLTQWSPPPPSGLTLARPRVCGQGSHRPNRPPPFPEKTLSAIQLRARLISVSSIAAVTIVGGAIATAVALPAQGTPDTTLAIVAGPLGARADSLLERLQSQGFSGVALVAKDGQVALKKGYGLANRASATPMTAASVIQIGSNTKDFTIVAILQLMERGKLSLDDSIGGYFANVPADKRGITVRLLMNHQAGFDQHMGGDWEVVSRDEEITRALSAKLLFVPGTDRKYSNIGYSLLAAIIEKVSGASYDAYVRDNILNPIGLRDTGLLLPQFDTRRVARGYRDGKDMGTFLERPHAIDGPYWNLRGNGGMLSTVSDMYRFYRALMSDGPLLKPASRNLFFHPDAPVVLAGSDLTFYFFYSRNPVAGFDVILVSNSTDYPAPRAREELASALGLGGPGGPGEEIVTTTTPGGRGGTSPGGGASPGGGVSVGGGRRDAAGLDAPVAFPNTPAARAAREYLRAYLDADPTVIRKFLEERTIQNPADHRSADERVTAFKTMHDNMGFLTPISIGASTELEFTFRARAARAGEVTFTFTVEPSAPWRITSLRAEAR